MSVRQFWQVTLSVSEPKKMEWKNTANLVSPLYLHPPQVIKIVTATSTQNLMVAVVAGHNPILAKLPNARHIHPKIEIWRGHDDKEGDFLAPHEQPITGVFTSKFLRYLVNYDEALNDLRRPPDTSRPVAPPYAPPFNLDAFNEVFAVMQVFKQGMKLPIYKELLVNLKLKPVSIIECQNAKNVNDGFFIARFANYAVRLVFTSAHCLIVTAETCLSKSLPRSLPNEVLHQSKCPGCIASAKARLSERANQSAPIGASKLSCCCQDGFIMIYMSKHSCQSAPAELLLLKLSGHNMLTEFHMLARAAFQEQLLVGKKIFVLDVGDPKTNAPMSALTLHWINVRHSVLVRCFSGPRRNYHINILSLHHTAIMLQAPNRENYIV
jgi:hypothetical protein